VLARAGFHDTAWPGDVVCAYPPVRSLCGSGGSFVVYCLFLAVGQGVFPVLFFSGICLVMYFFKSSVTDLWMRAVGLLLLTVAFSAAVHHFKPGSWEGFPEGHGGVVGISAAFFLKAYFNTVGTRLVLLTTMLIGLLLAADDLVLR